MNVKFEASSPDWRYFAREAPPYAMQAKNQRSS